MTCSSTTKIILHTNMNVRNETKGKLTVKKSRLTMLVVIEVVIEMLFDVYAVVDVMVVVVFRC